MKKIVLIGCGSVGVSFVFSLLNQKIIDIEIAIIDANENKAKGEIIDFNHSLPFLDANIKIDYGTYDDCSNADIIVLCAGARQEQHQTRLDLLNKNAIIINDIVDNILKTDFKGILINASNPLDVLTTFIHKKINNKFKVIGTGTFLDTNRLKWEIKNRVNVSYQDIEAYVLGEHGDSLVIPWASIKVKGKNIKDILSLEDLNFIKDKVKNAGYELLNLKGYSSSAIGVAISQIVRIIICGKEEKIVLSCYDKDNDIFYGFPCILTKTKIERLPKLNLSKEENENLKKSINIIKEAYKKISI